MEFVNLAKQNQTAFSEPASTPDDRPSAWSKSPASRPFDMPPPVGSGAAGNEPDGNLYRGPDAAAAAAEVMALWAEVRPLVAGIFAPDGIETEEEYRNASVHGGFEQRAASTVNKVDRERDSQIVNYAEAVRHSDMDEDWVFIETEKFGPHTSGYDRVEHVDRAPYTTANPDCADPKVQDDINRWCRERREEDKQMGRVEDRVDVQFYDDKNPCPTCAHNIPAQVENDEINIDLFLAKQQIEGKYSGAFFEGSYEFDEDDKKPAALITRGRGLSTEAVKAENKNGIGKLETKREGINKKMAGLLKKKDEAENDKKLKPDQLAKWVDSLARKIRECEAEIEIIEQLMQQYEAKFLEIDKWPQIMDPEPAPIASAD